MYTEYVRNTKNYSRTFFPVIITIAHPPDRQLELIFSGRNNDQKSVNCTKWAFPPQQKRVEQKSVTEKQETPQQIISKLFLWNKETQYVLFGKSNKVLNIFEKQ